MLYNKLNENIIITIGVCVKNCESSIETAIKSIMKQNFPHEKMEIIFVDDASIDNTLSIIKSYIHKMDISSKIFYHEWKGLGFSRNVVINNAKGKYIIWVDGDMELSKSFVRKQVYFMENNPSIGIGKGKYGIYKTGLVSFLENMDFVILTHRPKKEISLTPLGTGGSIYNIKTIKEVGGFDENMTGSGEDQDLEYRIKKSGWLLKITPAVFYERRRETWRSLWTEYFWHGQGGYHLIRKNKRHIDLYKLLPPILVAIVFFRAIDAYKLTKEKIVFLLPFHYFFKRVAWLLGFLNNFLQK